MHLDALPPRARWPTVLWAAFVEVVRAEDWLAETFRRAQTGTDPYVAVRLAAYWRHLRRSQYYELLAWYRAGAECPSLSDAEDDSSSS